MNLDVSETSAFVLECSRFGSRRKTWLDFLLCHHTMFNKTLLLNEFVNNEMQ